MPQETFHLLSPAGFTQCRFQDDIFPTNQRGKETGKEEKEKDEKDKEDKEPTRLPYMNI